jgi:NAD(P)-dependent dehydrogenase (short-subunit alcohol dehydrogenase family)
MPHSSRVALITGCGKPIGIGNSTARALAAKGVAVVVSDVRPAGIANEHNAPGDLDANWGGVDSLVEQIVKSGGTATAVLGDVSQGGRCPPHTEEVLSRYGRLDILVNNAGAPAGRRPQRNRGRRSRPGT